MGPFWEEKEFRDLGKGLRDDEYRYISENLRCTVERNLAILLAWIIEELFVTSDRFSTMKHPAIQRWIPVAILHRDRNELKGIIALLEIQAIVPNHAR